MKNFSKVFLVGFILMLSLVVFGAREVVFWHGLSRDPDKSSIDAIINSFEKENPDIKVKMVLVPAAETDSSKLLTAVYAGTGPDLVYIDRFTVSQRAANNVLEPMEELLLKNNIDINVMKKEFYDFAIEECIFNNKMWFFNPSMSIINNTLLIFMMF